MEVVVIVSDADRRRDDANARKNSAKAARERAKRPKTEIDWPAAIERLKKMLDDIDERDRA